MVDSNWPSSSATRSAELVGASLGALLPPLGGLPALDALAGAPPLLGCPPAEALACPPLWALAGAPLAEELLEGELLDGELLEALLGALLLEEALADELLLDDALLEELAEELDEELDEELLLAVFSSSEKSISSGGSPSLLEEGSGGMRDSSERWSESLYTGVDELLLAVGSSALLLEERERRLDSSPSREAVLDSLLERSPDSMLGKEVFGCAWLLDVDMLGLRLLLGELGDGILLAVDGLDCDLLEDELEDCDCDCDCDCEGLDELDFDCCCGCAGGCCWVCWFLQPLMTAAITTTEARVCQRKPMDLSSVFFECRVKRCAIVRNAMSYLLMRSRAAAESRRPVLLLACSTVFIGAGFVGRINLLPVFPASQIKPTSLHQSNTNLCTIPVVSTGSPFSNRGRNLARLSTLRTRERMLTLLSGLALKICMLRALPNAVTS